MKTLLIARHAKSSWDDPELSDHDRPLNPRGRKAAPRMADWLEQQHVRPDLIISSTAARALETGRLMAAAWGAGPPETAGDLYLADPQTVLEVVRGAPDTSRRLMVIGHNPGLEALVAMLGGRPVRMPTAAVAVITLQLEHWRDLDWGIGARLEAVWRPRELPPIG